MTPEKKLAQLYTSLEQDAEAGRVPLAQSARDIIPGEGSAVAQVVCIGEAPGFHEHQERRPFVGRSGKLLRAVMVEHAQIEPSAAYITNIVKVRPPENRDPTPAEIEAFRPALNQEIEIINPQVIVTLGRFSMRKFLKDVKISQVHGRLHQLKWHDRPLFVLPMYHPAAALRSTAVKNAFMADFAKLPKILAWIGDRSVTPTFSAVVADSLL